jgi:Uncharacterized conserved protein
MNFNEIKIVSGSVFIENLPAFLKSLNDFSKLHNIKIQGFDARKIVDEEHLFFSIYRAREAFSSGVNEAKDLGLEVMRFSSGQKQIDKSFSMGLFEGKNRSLFIFFGETDEQLQKAQNEFEGVFEAISYEPISSDEKKPFLMKQFDISDTELNAAGECKLKDLVMERVALVDIVR